MWPARGSRRCDGSATGGTAICLAVRPFATWRRISVSRSVRLGAELEAGPCAMRRYSPSTNPARPGVNTARPSAVARTASPSSALDALLTRYPVAPAFTASRTSSRSSEAESTRIFDDGETVSTSAVACAPSPSGSRMSITTTFGCTTAALLRADATPSAVATTLKPSSARSRATASRQIGWSSTTITVGVSSVPIPSRFPARWSASRCHPANSSAPQSISKSRSGPRRRLRRAGRQGCRHRRRECSP